MRTKTDIIREIKAKTSKASPLVRSVFFRGLERRTKPQLERILKRVSVTREGDIRLN